MGPEPVVQRQRYAAASPRNHPGVTGYNVLSEEVFGD